MTPYVSKHTHFQGSISIFEKIFNHEVRTMTALCLKMFKFKQYFQHIHSFIVLE